MMTILMTIYVFVCMCSRSMHITECVW